MCLDFLLLQNSNHFLMCLLYCFLVQDRQLSIMSAVFFRNVLCRQLFPDTLQTNSLRFPLGEQLLAELEVLGSLPLGAVISEFPLGYLPNATNHTCLCRIQQYYVPTLPHTPTLLVKQAMVLATP